MDDCNDILRASRNLVCRSNCILQTFTGVYPFVKTKLLNTFCLSLYGFSQWKLSCKSISIKKSLSIKCLGRSGIYHGTHTQLLCTALPGFTASSSAVYLRSRELLHSALYSSLSVVQCVFLDSSYLCYTFIGYNTIYGNRHINPLITDDNSGVRVKDWVPH